MTDPAFLEKIMACKKVLDEQAVPFESRYVYLPLRAIRRSMDKRQWRRFAKTFCMTPRAMYRFAIRQRNSILTNAGRMKP